MKKVSLIRATLSFLVFLSFVGACLSEFRASAQQRVSQESQAQEGDSKTQHAQELKAKERKGKRGKGKVTPMIVPIDDGGGDGGGGGGGGGGGIGGGYTGDGHIWCDGWDRQGACAFSFPGVATGVELRRQLGAVHSGYDWQSFLSWYPQDIDGFGRFPVLDGNVGLISPHEPQPGSIVGGPLPGQVPLHRWSTRKGFKYSIYYAEYGGDYVYGGIAGYVWPAGDTRGFPLYQYYSQEYGHYYTNYRNEINCQPNVYWDFQGEMARVNWPAPASQALRSCRSVVFPGPCDAFAVARCQARGQVFNFGNCTCFDGLP